MTMARFEALLWLAQRASAAVLGVCVLVHLLTVVLAVQGGLSAVEILGRTRGSAAWALFYAVFVLAVAVHAPLGIRTIVRELTGWRGPTLDGATALFAFLLAVFGVRAVTGLVG
jgi:fumarate reductase subunit C